MTKSNAMTEIDGNALVRALRYSPAHFHKLRSELIRNGATDGAIVHAMAGATEILDSVGSLSVMKTPKTKHGKGNKETTR
jgi:hypothetical protein